ncbi:MAG TPA: hypothetical protein VM488_12505 [Pseudobacter sp.]|jgi:hypothetical protein|nr:hypothetical protein [Pseudobacter sp.]
MNTGWTMTDIGHSLTKYFVIAQQQSVRVPLHFIIIISQRSG